MFKNVQISWQISWTNNKNPAKLIVNKTNKSPSTIL